MELGQHGKRSFPYQINDGSSIVFVVVSQLDFYKGLKSFFLKISLQTLGK